MTRITMAALGLALVLGACGSDDKSSGSKLPRADEPVELDPADFSTRIDNPYWPMAPGTKWTYREREDSSEQRVDVTVTNRTKVIDGVRARVVHDVVSADGRLVEDTYDWFAQDKDGNVWYLGEDTREYANGKASTTKGSWEAGVDGAQAGVVMPAKPEVGMAYRQEHYEGEAEDAARVLSIDERVEVPFGGYAETLMTKDYTPLEPDLVEHKFYARGVGPVLAIATSGGTGREELVRFEKG